MAQNTLTKKTEIQEIDSVIMEGHFVIFTLDQLNFALPVGLVERIVRAVIITPVPGTPESVIGVINVQGKIIPVFNIRKLFGLPDRELKLSDQLIIARTSEHTISFITDMVTGVTNLLEQKTVPADRVFPGLEKIIEGLVFFEDGIILIYNLDKLFTLESIEVINLALMEQEKKEVHDVKEQAEEQIQAPKKITAKEKEIKDKKEVKTVKKKQEPKKTAAKRVQASVKKTVRTVARKPKGRRGSK
ncbi:MAG: purine-binding chemotaxis protein CheW [Bacteroidales bacterium]|nr:purine-binding chemotaxis protein CheW [Bacteroidales bacterium]